MAMMRKTTAPLSVFISCAPAPKDQELLEVFETHLSLLQYQGIITTWYHRKMLAGVDKHHMIDEHFNAASLILLLISADFFQTDECRAELQRALKRHASNDALVIPILLRPVHLYNAPFEHLLCLPRDEKPVTSWSNTDEAFANIVEEIRRAMDQYASWQEKSLSERERKLQVLLTDHSGFLRDRLESFVGRQQELAELQERINQRLQTGGYVMIIGQAGQGKSSIIAKLVERYGFEGTAFHFIPLNSGPDHQTSLLRNLMARLILKYDLSDFYVSSEHRTILRDYFPKVLNEIVAKGGQEVIFIDGLDQLEEDLNGIRDLSFLPNRPPKGIVFVLGTRPNDTLRSLELLKPQDEYRLSNLNRYGFDLILQHRGVALALILIDRLYYALQGNALYLDLVAKELAEHNVLSAEELVKRLADNPENLFSIATDRIRQRQLVLWREAIKPLLGALLVAQEPLTRQQLKQIVNVDADTLVDCLTRLGGLVIDNGEQRYSLFHLKFREFLCEDPSRPEKKYIFAQDEVESWHYQLAKWCEGNNLSSIWDADSYNVAEQSRRKYARHHYITHLYFAHHWQRLFTILDEGMYGREKLRMDPNMRSYIRDLDMGRQAAAWKGWSQEEAIGFLVQLWRYTLLRCTLTSRAESYPIERWEALVACGRAREAIEIAELLTDLHHKISILLRIAYQLSLRSNMEQERLGVLIRAQELVSIIEEKRERAKFCYEIGYAFTEIGEQARAEVTWKEAEVTIVGIETRSQKVELLREFVKTLIRAKQWDHAEAVANLIEESSIKAIVLCEFGQVLIQAQQWERANAIWAQVVEAALINKESQTLYTLSKFLIQSQQWKSAEVLIRNISKSKIRVAALQELGQTLVQSYQRERAEAIWVETEATIQIISDDETRVAALQELGQALVQSHQWERAEAIWKQLETQIHAIKDFKKKSIAFIELIKILIQLQQWKQATAMLEKAEVTIRSIEGSLEKIYSFYDLSLTLIWTHQWKKSEIIWKEAMEMESNLREDYKKEVWASTALKNKLGEIEQEQVETRRISRTLQHGHQIHLLNEKIKLAQDAIEELRTRREQAILKRCKSLMQLQQWKQAEIVIQLIEDDETKAIALWELWQSLRFAQQEEYAKAIWTQAKIATDNVKDNGEKRAALSKLCHALTQAQQWGYAETIAHTIKENKEKVTALEELGLALVQAQQWNHAEKVWIKAGAVVYALEESQEKATALRGLITALIRAQQWERANTLINSIEDLWGVRLEEDPSNFINIYDEEEVELEDFIEADSKNMESSFNLDEMLWQTQQWNYERHVVRVEASTYNPSNWEEIENLDKWEMRYLRHRRYSHTKDKIYALYALERSNGKISALHELSSALVRAQEWKRAEIVWAEVEEIIRTSKESWERAIVLRGLGKTLVRAGLPERAKPIWTEIKLIAQSINNDWLRITVMHDLLDLLIQEQQWEEAEILVNVLKEREKKVIASLKLGRALIQAQQWRRAESVIQTIERNKERALALIELGRALIKDQQHKHAEMIWEKANSALLNINEKEQRLEVLRQLTDALLQGQQRQKAESLWIEAVNITRTLDKREDRIAILQVLWQMLIQADPSNETSIKAHKIKDRWERAIALGELGRACVLANKLEQAKELFAESEAIANTLFPREKAEILRELSKLLMQVGLWDWSEAIARAIEQSWERDRALSELSLAREQTKSWEEAMIAAQTIEGEREGAITWHSLSLKLAQEKQWVEAEWAARSIESIEKRTVALNELGQRLIEAQQWERAEFVARAIEMRWERVATLGELGRGLAEIQQWERAKSLWIEAEKTVRAFKDSKERAIALRELGKKLALAKQQGWADRLWLESIAEANCIREDKARTVALYELAVVLAQALKWEQAAVITRTIEGKEERTLALCQLSEALARNQRWKRAEVLARVVRDKEKRATTLLNLSRILVEAQQWGQAKRVAKSIEVEQWQATALRELSQALIEVQQWESAIEVVWAIKSHKIRMEAIQQLGYQLEAAGAYESLLHFIQLSWLQVTERVEALMLLALANGLILLKPEIGNSFYETFKWVDAFLKG